MNKFFKKSPHWFVCLLSIIGVSLYWVFWASDRYVSEANVVLESPQLAAPTLNFQSLLSGGGANNQDMLLLRDHLLSVDMLKKLDIQLDLKSHYSNASIDFFSRLSKNNLTIEEFHDYYLQRISVELDDYAGVLRIEVQAFTPEMAHQIANLMLSMGEDHMNLMGKRLAEEQVRFLEAQVVTLAELFDAARQDMIDYQNKNGLVSPGGTVESLSLVVGNLEARLANLRASKSALLSYQSEQSSNVKSVESEIKALQKQIDLERARMAQNSGNALNVLSFEYQALELRAGFAQTSYSSALVALENTRIEAARKLKQVSVLQAPTIPEYSEEPRRLHNTVVFTLLAIFSCFILHMLILIIKDHKD